jgi:hypothetical protein
VLAEVNDGAGAFGDRVIDRRRHGGARRLVKGLQGRLGAQQFLDLSAEENVAGTDLVEKGRPAVRRVLVDRRQEDCFHFVGLLAHHLRSRGTDAALHTNADFGCGFLTTDEKICK